MSIPHIFHQVWFDLGSGPLPPPRFNKFQDSWRRNHPDAKFILWNEKMVNQLLQKHHPEFIPIFKSYKNRISQIDAIRIFILLNYGGVYLDMDLYSDQCLYPLIESKENEAKVIVVKCSMIPSMINNFFIATPPNHPFMWYLVQQLRVRAASRLHLNKSIVGTLYTAGPWFLHQSVYKYHNHQSEISVLPHTYFSKAESEKGNPETYGWHEYSNTWGVPQKFIVDELRFLVLPFFVIVTIVVLIRYLSSKKHR